MIKKFGARQFVFTPPTRKIPATAKYDDALAKLSDKELDGIFNATRYKYRRVGNSIELSAILPEEEASLPLPTPSSSHAQRAPKHRNNDCNLQ